MKGVDAIEHMASPFHENVDDPEGVFASTPSASSTSFRSYTSENSEFIRPAVDGTLGILKSALKNK